MYSHKKFSLNQIISKSLAVIKPVHLKKEKYFGIILIITSFLTLRISGCSELNQDRSNKSFSEFKYIIFYTSYLKNKSVVSLLDEKGNSVKNISLKVGGLGGILSRKIRERNNKIYLPISGVPSSPDGKVLELDLLSLNIKYIKTELFPMDLDIDQNYLYVAHNSSIRSSFITKIDLKDNKIIKTAEVLGVLPSLSTAKNYIYVTAEDPASKSQKIYKLSQDLTELRVFQNKFTASTTDIEKSDQKLLISGASTAYLDEPSSGYVELNIKDNELKFVKLSEVSPYQIFISQNRIIITHYYYPLNIGSKLTVFNLNSSEYKIYQLKNILFQSQINNDSFYSIGKSIDNDKSIYSINQYKIKDFSSSGKIEVRNIDDLVISGIFVK